MTMKETIPSHWYHDKLMRDVDDAEWLKDDTNQDDTVEDLEEIDALCTQ